MHHVSIGESEEGKVSPAAGGEGRGGWKRGVEESRGGRGGLRGLRGQRGAEGTEGEEGAEGGRGGQRRVEDSSMN